MNKKELVNLLYRECSAAGSGVTTTIGQTGEAARMVGWVEQAYQDVQNEYFDWRFLSGEVAIATSTITDIIVPPIDLNTWDEERVFDSDGNYIEIIDFTEERLPVNSDTGKPNKFIIQADNTLKAHPKPDGIYNYSIGYFKVPHIMTIDSDEPIIPEHFQRAIIGRAVIYYANYESASELKQQGSEIYQELLLKLRHHQSNRGRRFYGRSEPMDIVVVTS